MPYILYAALKHLIDGKQPIIPDLDQIRAGAAKGSTSVQPNDPVSSLQNDAGYLTLSTLPIWDGGYVDVN